LAITIQIQIDPIKSVPESPGWGFDDSYEFTPEELTKVKAIVAEFVTKLSQIQYTRHQMFLGTQLYDIET